MQKALLILGALMVVAGLLVASGMMKYQDKDKVDFGSLEIEASHEEQAPPNWGYLLLGIGAVALVGGAVMRRS